MNDNKEDRILRLISDSANDELETKEESPRIDQTSEEYKGIKLYEELQKQQEVAEYVTIKTNSLDDIIKSEGANIQDEEFIKFLNNIEKIIYIFKTDIFNLELSDKQDVDQLYTACMLFIKLEFEKFKSSFYQKNQIDENKVKETLNYDCTLKEFYQQLLEIKEKYTKEEEIKKRLEEEIKKYKTYAGYEIVRTLVDTYKNNALYNIKTNNYQNIEQEIEKMHQQIMTEVFEVYDFLKKKLADLETIINNIADANIKEQYKEIKNDFENGDISFDETNKNIIELENLIAEYKNNPKRKEQAINEIYNALIDRYSEVVKSYNIITEYTAIIGSTGLLYETNMIFDLFKKGINEDKDLEYFNQFNQIEFRDIVQDFEIINKLRNISNQKIYIKRKDSYMDFADDTSFFLYDKDEMIMYQVAQNSITHKKINPQELQQEYMPLEEFLETSTYIGEMRTNTNSEGVLLLYELDGITIYLKDKTLDFYIENNPILTRHRYGIEKINSNFGDKKSIYFLIEEQIKKRIEEYKKNQSISPEHYINAKNNNYPFDETESNKQDRYDSSPSSGRKK